MGHTTPLWSLLYSTIILYDKQITFIKQKLSEMISQNNGSMVKDVSVRYGGPWFEL